MKRVRPVRSRLEVPAGYFGLAWRESVHEGGHAVMTFLFGDGVEHVSLVPYPGKAYTRTVLAHWVGGPVTSALVSAAGAAAERARGLRSARPSPDDRACFQEAIGRAVSMDPYIDAAERLFRTPVVAPLLTAAAEFLYQRYGEVVIGGDLRCALPEDLDTAMALADAAHSSLARRGVTP